MNTVEYANLALQTKAGETLMLDVRITTIEENKCGMGVFKEGIKYTEFFESSKSFAYCIKALYEHGLDKPKLEELGLFFA